MKRLLILLLFPLMMFSQDSTLIGDVDCSGEVNSQDASLILQFVTNVIDSLPCEANMTGLTPDQLQEIINMMEEQLNINYSGGNSGSYSFNYPDGFHGEPVFHDFEANNSYTVPEGKNLYVNMIYHNTGNDVLINSKKIHNSGTLNYSLNIVLSEGDVISVTTDPGNTPTHKNMFGLLVDKKVQSLIHDFITDGPYTVPDGKKLYIYRIYHNQSEVEINSYVLSNYNNFILGSNNASFDRHLVLKAGDIIDITNNGGVADEPSDYENMFGYLADEDYFSSVGSGSTVNDNFQLSNNFELECVDMGVSSQCAELSNSASLESIDGYSYSMTDDNLSDNILEPHWRKFKIQGLENFLIEDGQLMFKCKQSPPSDTYSFFISPEITNEGVFFYFYQNKEDNGCLTQENIGLSIPLEHAYSVFSCTYTSTGGYQCTSVTEFEIFYQSSGSYKSTSIIFDWD